MYVLATLLLSGSVLAASPEVKLASGTVRGSTCSSGVQRFLGIPYAESTGGKNRFMPPVPFNGTLGKDGSPFDATKNAPCTQFSLQFGEDSPAASEDCLTVDVYVPPSAKADAKLPVKVWAYGGSNEGGATSDKLYDACTLASDAVVVELNYRLGPMGFLALGDAGIAGNMAIQDYLAALEWVQKNVASFGGDKDHVVLFGQSAGADDVFTVSTLPQAPKLIKAAILESGGGMFLSAKKDAETVGASFADALKCPKGKDQLSCLQKASVDDIKKVYEKVPALQNSTRPGQFPSDNFGISVPNTLGIPSAILDGKIIAEEPLATGSKVPVLAGAAERDTTLFVIPALLQQNKTYTARDYEQFLASWGKYGAQIGKRYPLSLFNDTGDTNHAFYEAVSAITTLSGYVCPSMYAAQAARNGAWVYRWNHTLSCPFSQPSALNYAPFPSAQLRDVFGPTHISDLPFVFGNLVHMPMENGTCNATKEEYALSDKMRASWTAMAKNADPSIDGLAWPKFSSCDARGVQFNDGAAISKIDFGECAFWGGIWNDMAGAKLDWLGKACSNTSSAAPGASGTTAPPGASVASGTSGSQPAKPTSASNKLSTGLYGVAAMVFVLLLA